MSLKATWFRDKLRKKAKQGFQGFPLATITYYGPTASQASKVSVGIVMQEGGEVTALERWHNELADVRLDAKVNEEIVSFLKQHGVKSVISPDRLLGCPHEEGTDYPNGEKCPRCLYWANRDRFTGEVVQ